MPRGLYPYGLKYLFASVVVEKCLMKFDSKSFKTRFTFSELAQQTVNMWVYAMHNAAHRYFFGRWRNVDLNVYIWQVYRWYLIVKVNCKLSAVARCRGFRHLPGRSQSMSNSDFGLSTVLSISMSTSSEVIDSISFASSWFEICFISGIGELDFDTPSLLFVVVMSLKGALNGGRYGLFRADPEYSEVDATTKLSTTKYHLKRYFTHGDLDCSLP